MGYIIKIIRLLLCAAVFAISFAGRWSDMVRSLPEQAEQAYKQKDYQKALEFYQEAQTQNPDSDTLAYNLGNTMYKLGRYQEAGKLYNRILENKNPVLSADSYYNMGNTLYRMGRATDDQQSYSQAVEAFKQAVMLDPEDRDAKYNYELVKRLLKEQQQQQQQNQDQQDQEKKQDQQQQQKDDKQQQQDRNRKDQEQQQQQQQEQTREQQPRPKPGQMSKEEAERILEALAQMEKNEQEKKKEKKAPANRGGPDW